MNLRWSRRARQHLESIFLYLWDENPQAAVKIHESLLSATEALADQPTMGRPGTVCSATVAEGRVRRS